MSLSVSDRLLIMDLLRRVGALEARDAAIRKPLTDQAAANRAAGEALYAEVRAIVEQHRGPDRLTGKHVLARLTRDPKPSVRQVQDLMRRARAESAASRS